MVENTKKPIRIDLNEFKLHIHLKKIQLTLHFDSPSRRFYLSVIALVVNEMKRLGRVTSIPLEGHLGLLVLLNETIGGSAGSSDRENLLPRIYRKWKDALPDLEDAPLFKVLGRKKEYDEGIGRTYPFPEAEKDTWANLFEYQGSEENVRLKFAVDKLGVSLKETSIIFGDSLNGKVWDRFISSLKKDRMNHPLPDEPSIVVLPFKNMSEDRGQEFFSDGLTEEITTSLSKLPQIFVIARNSAFIYKGKPTRVAQVAQELGVRYIVEGSVRRAGEKVRINAQLIDATKGYHLWADRYDGTLKDVFALQDHITQKIVTALAIKLTGNEKELIVEKGTDNLAAYDEFLKGWFHYLRMTPDDVPKALQSFNKATELDATFGRAYAAMALAYWTGSSFSGLGAWLGISWIEARFRSRQYLYQAMKNPTSIAHLVNSQFYLYLRRHEEAVSELEKAISLDPQNPSCYALMGNVLLFMGKPQDAVNCINRAMRLDPQNPSFYLSRLGAAKFCMRKLEEAADLLERALRLNPEVPALPTGFLASTYGLLGREQEARAALDIHKKGFMIGPPSSLASIMSNYAFKDPAVANRFAEGIIKAGMPGRPSDYFPAYKENQLTEKEIKSLLCGSTTTGFDLTGQQWWIDLKKNGDLIVRGPGQIASDIGKGRIEGNYIWTQFQKRMSGVEYCSTIFRNPNGTHEYLGEYFIVADYGFIPFSPTR
jgi:adenylate cyclase